jgi:hypothetical protein
MRVRRAQQPVHSPGLRRLLPPAPPQLTKGQGRRGQGTGHRTKHKHPFSKRTQRPPDSAISQSFPDAYSDFRSAIPVRTPFACARRGRPRDWKLETRNWKLRPLSHFPTFSLSYIVTPPLPLPNPLSTQALHLVQNPLGACTRTLAKLTGLRYTARKRRGKTPLTSCKERMP